LPHAHIGSGSELTRRGEIMRVGGLNTPLCTLQEDIPGVILQGN
jgi:hypothetical protein